MANATIILVLIVGVSLTWAQNCWQTGCQPSNWAVVGCAQYGRDERGREACWNGGSSGFKYNCCERGGGGGGQGQEQGICSWYGAQGEIPPGWPTACGEGFDRFAMKAAHKTLPCGTRIRVKNLENGRTVDVTINDRGPFTPGRIVDLSYAAFGRVENRHKGLFRCSYQVI